MTLDRILVTGASGQLGGELCRQLGRRACVLGDRDLTDAAAVRADLQESLPQAVINCAAYTAVDRAETDAELCRAVNAEAVATLARLCREADIPLVQISTDYVFCGAGLGRPWREDDPPHPLGVYAETKRAGELAAQTAPKHLVVRTCGLYARPSDEQARNFVRTMLRLGASGKPLRVVDDQHCTPSYVPHVAAAVAYLLEAADRGLAPWGLYHVTNRGATTWHQLALEIFRLAGQTVAIEPITTAQYAAAAPRPHYSVLDTTRYEQVAAAHGGPPLPDWQAALREYFASEEAAPC